MDIRAVLVAKRRFLNTCGPWRGARCWVQYCWWTTQICHPSILSRGSSSNPKSPGKGKEKKKAEAKKKVAQPPLGHLLLRVANLDRYRDEDSYILIEIYDSGPSHVPEDEIHRKVEEILTKFGLLRDGVSEKPKLVFDHVAAIEKFGSNSCGIFVILNAWAVMLEILIRPHKPAEKIKDVDFIGKAVEIVRLVLAGFMDSNTTY